MPLKFNDINNSLRRAKRKKKKKDDVHGRRYRSRRPTSTESHMRYVRSIPVPCSAIKKSARGRCRKEKKSHLSPRGISTRSPVYYSPSPHVRYTRMQSTRTRTRARAYTHTDAHAHSPHIDTHVRPTDAYTPV